MVEDQFPPCIWIKLLHSDIWWSNGLELIDKDSRTPKSLICITRISNLWMMSKISNIGIFFYGINHKGILTSCQLRLEIGSCSQIFFLDNGDTYLMLTRIPPTLDHKVDFTWTERRTLFLSYNTWPFFIPHEYNYTVFLCLPNTTLPVGTHSQCLNEWENPTWDWLIFFPWGQNNSSSECH